MSQGLSLYNAMGDLDRALENMNHVLKKGEANATERGIDPSVFLNARLAPDMFNLIGQVQVAASIAKACPHRIVGTEPPVYENTEESFADLYALIAKARGELASFTRGDIDGKELREFSVKLGPTVRDFTAIAYLAGFSIPNVHFHATTVYNILRHNGVPIGKLDFFGGPKA